MEALTGEFIPKSEKKHESAIGYRFRAMEWIEKLSVSPPEANVLLYLSHRVDAKMSCFPSRGRIAMGTKLSERTVSRVLANLESMQILKVIRTREKNGHLKFKQIKLLMPGYCQLSPALKDVTVSPGPCDTESNNELYLGDTLSQVNIQSLDKYSEEEKIETKMVAIEQVDCSDSSLTEVGKGEEGKSTIPESFNSLMGLGMAGVLYPEKCTIVHSGVGKELSRITAGNLLVRQYAEACSKGSPKARVAFWHAIGRLYFPHLPRFSKRHKLTPNHSACLHQVFDDLESLACPVLASLFSGRVVIASQTSSLSGYSGQYPTVPDPEFIKLNIDQLRAFWLEKLRALRMESEEDWQKVSLWLGFDGVDSLSASQVI